MREDVELRNDVIDQLVWEPGIDAARIDVAVNNRQVVLSGVVPSYNEKVTAEEAAFNVAGIKSVMNELEVEPISDAIRTDEEIADAAANSLIWDTSVPDEKISVRVQNGWITLEGEVERYDQKKAASNAVSVLSGVLGITNRISIKPTATAENSQEQIKKALKRDGLVNADEVTVTVEGSTAILGGTVDTGVERRRAERAAWATPGVLTVQNNISVGAFES